MRGRHPPPCPCRKTLFIYTCLSINIFLQMLKVDYKLFQLELLINCGL